MKLLKKYVIEIPTLKLFLNGGLGAVFFKDAIVSVWFWVIDKVNDDEYIDIIPYNIKVIDTEDNVILVEILNEDKKQILISLSNIDIAIGGITNSYINYTKENFRRQ